MKRGRFRWELFWAALALSLAFHLFVVVPYVLAPLVEKPDVPLEVAIQDEPAAPLQESTEPQAEPPREPPRPPELARAPEPALVEPPKLQPEPPKPPVKPVQVQPIEPPKRRMQMVHQDRYEEEADNPDARFLAQKNHRTQNETQARETNLVREVEGADRPPTEESDNKGPDVGAKRDQVAELQDRAGPDKTLPRSPSRPGSASEGSDTPRSGPLSMRDLTPRAPGAAARDGLELSEAEGGTLPRARVGHDGARSHAPERGNKGAQLALDHQMYDRIVGFETAERERQQAARAQSSHKAGRYERYLAKAQALRSSIENYLPPDVRPGNQTELGTRKSPFAAYITAMHRQIHKLFGDGFLASIEGRHTPYDDHELWTKLEVVVNSDGSLHKASIVRTSGVTGFDVAALDSVMSAAPFPVPPKDIRSANGKVYIHWQFHRSEDACGTFNVDPFILTKVAGDEPRDQPQSGVDLARAGGPKRLSREAPTPTRPLQAVESLPASAEAPAETPQVTPQAKSAAEGWFAAYGRGDAAWLSGWSATPFTAAGETVAADAKALKRVYAQLIAEAPKSRKLESLDVLTPAGIRGRLGGLPPGGEETTMLYAVGRAGGEEFILLLKKSNAGWRVAGIDR